MLNTEIIDELGRWSSIKIGGNGRNVQIITMCRIPMSSKEGIYSSKAQHDRKTGNIQNAKKHRTEVLKSITNLVNSMEKVEDVTLAGDFNEDIEYEDIERFMVVNGLTDVFWHANKADVEIREKTCIRGKRCIDSITVTEGLLLHVIGCKMVNFCEIIVTDHRGFVIDVDINTCLNVKTSEFDEIDSVCLNPRRLSHKLKFVKKAE